MPAAERGGARFTAFLVWLSIVYLTVPAAYMRGEMDLMAADSNMSAGDTVGRTIKMGLLICSVGIIGWRSAVAIAVFKRVNRFFLVFLALVPASILWSIDPGATSARYVSLLTMVAVSLCFTVTGWSRTHFQDVVRPAVTILCLASMIFGMLYPQYAIEVGDGTLKDSWRGLTAQKNQFGMLSSIGALLWLHAWFNKEKRWFVAVPFIAMCLTCVLWSRSSTSLLATLMSTLFMVLVMVIPKSLRRYMPIIASSFATLVVVYALAVLHVIPGIGILLDPIANLAGKDLTFSNRAVIWDILKEHIAYAPFLGTGYGAYWTGPIPGSASYTFLQRMYFYPTQAHNGYIEIVNDLGFVGLTVLLAYLFVWVRQSLRLIKVDRGQGMLFLAIFFQQATTNLSESTWLAINSAFAIFVVTLATFCMARCLLDARNMGRIR